MCGKGYESTISALEAGLGLNAGVVCIQEQFLGNKDLSHVGFNLYWPSGVHNRKDNRVLVAVRKDILNKIIVKNQTDLVSHPYCMALDITEFGSLLSGRKRKTRIINVYDNKIGEGQRWQGSSPRVRRAIEDMSWQSLIKHRVLIVGDMNAHSTMWNPHCHKRQNAGPLETLIETYELFVNNDLDYATRPSSGGISIVDLALTSPQLGPLRVWEIPEEYLSLFDHELILVEWDEMEEEKSRFQQGSSTGWSIQNLLDDEQLFSTARTAWIHEEGIGRPYLSIESSMQDLDDEVEWFEAKLSQLLDRHAKITRVGAYSKRW